MAGLALIALGRGILRGQRRAWRVSVVLLAGTILLHLVAGADFEESLIAGAGPGLPAGQPQGVPGRLRRHLAALRPHHPGRVALGVAVVATVVPRAVHPHRAPPPPRRAALVDDVLGRVRAVRRDHHHRPPPSAGPVPRPRPADHRDLPGGRDPLPADPPGGRPPAELGPGGRVPGPRHRPAPRLVHPRLLRPPVGQEVVLPPRQPGGLRRLRRGLPHLPRPHRAPQRARAGVGRLPGLRRHPRLDDLGHGGGRGLAPHLPRLGHAQHLPGRRGRREAPGVQPGRQAHEGAPPGPQPDQEVRLHGHLPRPFARSTRHSPTS